MTLQINRKHFTIDEYHKLAETGIIKPTDRVELIEGDIITMSPIKSKHAGIVDAIAEFLIHTLYRKATIKIQNPMSIGNNSEPEPDIIIAKHKQDHYRSAHPTPEEVYLLIEVADSSLAYDQSIKAPLYAKAGIPEYWIINIIDEQIEIYREPGDENYASKQILSTPTPAEAQNLDLTIPFEIIFPKV
jgi:Uma2 family endonuclease